VLTALQIFRAFTATNVVFAVCCASGADYRPPGGERYPLITASGSILPGGRILKPFGREIETGPGPFGLAVSPKGIIATANSGFERYGVTVIEPSSKGAAWEEHNIWARTPNMTAPEIADPDWKGVSDGIVFDSEKSVWVSEGASGKVRQLDIRSGDHRKIVSLNTGEWRNSFTGRLAYDVVRRLLYVVDRTHSRVAVVDAKSGNLISSVRLENVPSAIALSPDGMTAWVAGAGIISAVDVRDSMQPEIRDRIRNESTAGSVPGSILVTAERVFVSDPQKDSITVVSVRDRRIAAEIPLTIPTLEQFRGVAPAGMAYDPVTKWLLVAESGINAVGVVDTEKNQSIGHIPVGWKPSQVAISGDRVYVSNALGRGTGPNLRRPLLALGEVPVLHRGTVTTFIMPDVAEVLRQTGIVFNANGFIPVADHNAPVAAGAIRHVVVIATGGHTFDEVLGDIARAPQLARFGMHGLAQGRPGEFSVKDAQVTPNHHGIAQRWAFSDNYYADEEGIAPRLADVWKHLEQHGVTWRKFEDARADQFIAGIEREPLPQLVYVELAQKPVRAEGYRYEASFVADGDLETGRIVEYLSHSPWWRDTAVFITGRDTGNGLDHIDSHRTTLLAAGPYVKRNYVSHTNADFAGLLKTVFELLKVPPLHLADATAASLRDLFTNEPQIEPYTAVLPDSRVFTPADKSPGGNAEPEPAR
jgi:YVTN family beta-propeller protein